MRRSAVFLLLLFVFVAFFAWWFRGGEKQQAPAPSEKPAGWRQAEAMPEEPIRSPVEAPRPFRLKLTSQAEIDQRLKRFHSGNESVDRLYRQALTSSPPGRLKAVKRLGALEAPETFTALIDLATVNWPDAREREMFWEAVTYELFRRFQDIPLNYYDKLNTAIDELLKLRPRNITFWKIVKIKTGSEYIPLKTRREPVYLWPRHASILREYLLNARVKLALQKEIASLKEPRRLRRLVKMAWIDRCRMASRLDNHKPLPITPAIRRFLVGQSFAEKELKEYPDEAIIAIVDEISQSDLCSEGKRAAFRYIYERFRSNPDKKGFYDFYWRHRIFVVLADNAPERYLPRIYEWLKEQPYLSERLDRPPKADIQIIHALRVLARHRYKPLIPLLVEILTSRNHRYFYEAGSAVRRFRDDGIPIWIQMTESKDRAIRHIGIRNLLNHPSRRVADELRDYLHKHPHEFDVSPGRIETMLKRVNGNIARLGAEESTNLKLYSLLKQYPEEPKGDSDRKR